MSVYERLRVLHERSRALVTGLLRVRDWQPAISVWDCHPGWVNGGIFLHFIWKMSAMSAQGHSNSLKSSSSRFAVDVLQPFWQGRKAGARTMVDPSRARNLTKRLVLPGA